jgi:P4 family phage/plasmid primase-like protien
MANMNFDAYLRSKAAKAGNEPTHTRVPSKNKASGIFGGSYHISDEEWPEFMAQYYQHVFVKGNKEYLTEKQLNDEGPILIDLDFHYKKNVIKRQHTEEHIIDAIIRYAEKLDEIVKFPEEEGVSFPVYVMEKPDINQTASTEYNKDGIHLKMDVVLPYAQQLLLRDKMLPELAVLWEGLPISNTWDKVIDIGIPKGTTNWQLYGSRKPENQAYVLTYHFQLTYTLEDGWTYEKIPVSKFDFSKNLRKLSARYTADQQTFPLRPGVLVSGPTRPKFKANASTGLTGLSGTGLSGTGLSGTGLSGTGMAEAFADEATLDAYLLEQFADVNALNYKIKETHEYTMTLPEEYYGPGSYEKWLGVGMALKNTDASLFPTWIRFSCQSSEFDWAEDVERLYQQWQKFAHKNPLGLTYRSIMYWSKKDAREKYNEIRKDTIDFFVTQTIQHPTDFDLALVLYNMTKDKYVCTSITRRTWLEYINHRWHEIDSGNTLRMTISKEMHQIYHQKSTELSTKLSTMDQSNTDACDKIRKQANKLVEICVTLKKTQPKQNIMREAAEIFFDNNFMEKLDKNPYLICFNNGVVDFKQKIFRKGQHDDYISKCTNCDYIPYDVVTRKHTQTIAEIGEFMAQLFPIKELENYMWDHLASTLIGVNTNQTFHVYKGSGRNGKSALTALMTKCLGTYKGDVPITLITGKRGIIGSTSSEVAQLNGVRYAVMAEPTKGDKINEGALKELTGGTDPITARALFKDAISFIPMFKLVVCTNVDFEDTSQDDGTWRRFRYIEFMSKFMVQPYEDEKYPRSDVPYQFPLDVKLSEKFEAWVPVFMSMLVERSFVNQGVVKDCKIVMANSNDHREKQDFFVGFLKECVMKQPGSVIKKTALMEVFKEWYTENHGKTLPKGKEITELMNQRFGIYQKTGWQNVSLIYGDAADELDAL